MLGTKLQYERPVPRWRSPTTGAIGVISGVAIALALPFPPGAPWGAVLLGVAMVVPTCWALAWVVLVGPFVARSPRHPEETAEWTWFERARGSAFYDVMTLAGLGLVAAVILGAPASTQAVLAAVLVLGWGDALVRSAASARRAG